MKPTPRIGTPLARGLLMRKFIEDQTRRVSKAWISNRALYDAFIRQLPWSPKLIETVFPFQRFSRFLGHDLDIPTVRRWVDGHQVYGRHLWPLEEIRRHLNFGVDFI